MVVKRARDVLNALEKGEREGSSRYKATIDNLPLFSQAKGATPIAPTKNNVVQEALESVYPDELSPREALQKLYELKELLQKS